MGVHLSFFVCDNFRVYEIAKSTTKFPFSVLSKLNVDDQDSLTRSRSPVDASVGTEYEREQ